MTSLPALLSQYAGSAALQQKLAQYSYEPSVYRYLTTDLLTGAVTGDWLPLTVMNFSRQISTASMLSSSLNLRSDDPLAAATNLASVTPRKSVLWVLQDNVPVWNGIIWDWQHMSILDNTLPLSCSSMESILQHRMITEDLVFTNADVFDMARGLIQYALGLSPNGQVAGFTYTQGQSGIVDSLTFDGSQNQYVSDALNTLVTDYEIEYSFRPYMDADGNLYTSVDLATSGNLGNAPYPASGLTYSFPGNLLDYRFTATGSTSANYVLATASSSDGSGSTLAGIAIDQIDIDNGYPLLQVAVQPQGTVFSSDAQLANYAAGYLPSVTETQLTPLLTLAPGAQPEIKNTPLGAYAAFAATSPLHPAGPGGQPGFEGIGRVTAWTCYPPSSSQTEYAWVQLGGMTMTP